MYQRAVHCAIYSTMGWKPFWRSIPIFIIIIFQVYFFHLSFVAQIEFSWISLEYTGIFEKLNPIACDISWIHSKKLNWQKSFFHLTTKGPTLDVLVRFEAGTIEFHVISIYSLLSWKDSGFYDWLMQTYKIQKKSIL